ncbi:MAG: diadenylate cyclase CdaA, partial [Ignavibacteria bacterium]|nr:diadenylate cyclase CdaA [Ignavibacteria bacterium]
MELFKIGFLTVRFIDIVDILIVSYIFYKLYRIMRGTIAFQIFISLLLILGTSFLAQILNFQVLGWLLNKLTDIWVIALIILFQPEIRRLLIIIGRTRIARLFMRIDLNENVTEVVDACVEFQKNGWGALIVITRSAGLQNIVETGEMIDAKINKELLVSIFYPRSPLHDGAVIINNNKIEAARCLLPLSETQFLINRRLGTRHRAGLGISEQSDAITVIVSEETSNISVAEDGKLHICKDVDELKEKLKDAMSSSNVTKSLKSILESTKD